MVYGLRMYSMRSSHFCVRLTKREMRGTHARAIKNLGREGIKTPAPELLSR